MATKIFLYDTTVFIDYFRGKQNSQKWIDPIIKGNHKAAICLIIDVELWAGAKNAEDKIKYQTLLSRFQRLNINITIARRAGELLRPLFLAKDKSVSPQDAIIAATAEYYRTGILSQNSKHFDKLLLKNVTIQTY